MNYIPILPHLLTVFNVSTVLLLCAGYYQIRAHNKKAHKALMIGALFVAMLFIIAYVTYHIQVGNIKFAGEGVIRTVYFSILISHVLLAALVLPMIFMTVTYALRGKFAKHRRLAPWTLGIWLYVSVTGVLVYLLAFHIYANS